ncbi:MAG TPA: xanthine dehydrogenase family protein molybdopterin-binding subunit [Steroidobacteraceae bacterium]|nr:xanthine dehydrogenase family protein molybdopterin-binding subunit [Steroidobacteraceae bacterium]
MSYKLLGQDFTPPDVYAKVTGQARYAEDFRADGMVFCRLLGSPMPHARVRGIDVSQALAMPGVLSVLLPQEVTPVAEPNPPILTLEPQYVGAPILALAALDETTAQGALERVVLDLEPLPFTVDPLQALHPDGPDPRADGNNVGAQGLALQRIKWTAEDFASVPPGELPPGKAAEEWSYGDLAAGFAHSRIVYDDSFVTAGNSHHSMEPRSCFAYWENGKCFVHGSTQSQSFIVPALAQFIGITPAELVYIAEFCGGGFGSKGNAYPSMAIPALMAKKLNRPVMMRISRAEEYSIGHARNGFQGRVKLGFGADGRLLAADLFLVQDSGACNGFWDFRNAADALSVVYQPEAMRWRGIPVYTNTPTRSAQRGPGENQIACILEPLLDRAARDLGIDRLEIRRRNAPRTGSAVGSDRRAVTSCYLREALDKGAEGFGWTARAARSGQRRGPKVTGIGIGQAYHPAGFSGFDGLVRITPDGRLHIHTGVGNLGTYSHSGTARVAAEVLKYDWEQCVVERGDSRRHLPWNIGQFGSNTSFTMARTNYVAAVDLLAKLKAIAAHDLGGTPDDYDIDGKRVYAAAHPARGLTYAAAAQRAAILGGRYSGYELPADINPMTRASAAALAGTGLIGVAKDTLPTGGETAAFACAFAEVEVDLETGQHRVIDILNIGDCGTVIHPMGLATQMKGATVQGISIGTLEHILYDPQNGLPGHVGLYQARPATYLDVPPQLHADWVDLPDPVSPMGTKGIGEPPLGAAASAVICAICDALSGHVFNRTPVKLDMVLRAAAGLPPAHAPLAVSTD